MTQQQMTIMNKSAYLLKLLRASAVAMLPMVLGVYADITSGQIPASNSSVTDQFSGFSSSAAFPIVSLGKRPPPSLTTPQSRVFTAIGDAEFMIKAGQWKAAAEELKTALGISPHNPTALQLAGHVALMREQLEYAENCFQQLCKIQPDNSAHLARWAAILLRLKQPQRAGAMLKAAIEQEPNNLVARFNLAVLELSQTNVAAAARALTPRRIEDLGTFATWAAVDDDPFLRAFLSPYQFTQLGQLILAGGETNAITDISGVQLTENLRNVSSLLWRAHQSIVNGQEQDAIAAIHAARELGSKAPVLTQDSAFYQFRLGDQSDALRELRTLVAQYPKQDAIQTTLGILLLETKQFEASAQAFAAATELAPENYEAAMGGACALAAMGNRAAARSILANLAARYGNKLNIWLNTSSAASLKNDAELMTWLQELLQK